MITSLHLHSTCVTIIQMINFHKRSKPKTKTRCTNPFSESGLRYFRIFLRKEVNLKQNAAAQYISNANKLVYTFFFYRQLALWRQIAEQLSGLSTFSLSNNKNYRLKKVEFFVCNKCKITVKLTMHHNTAFVKALLGNFKITDHKYQF